MLLGLKVGASVIERRGEGIGEVEPGAVDLGLLDAGSRLQAQPGGHLQLLEPEGGDAVGARGIEQRVAFEAQALHVAMADLRADCPAQLAQRRLDGLVLDLDAPFLLAVGEARADLELAVGDQQLVVGVAAGAEPIADRLDAVRAHAPFALRQHLVLLHVDALAFLGRLAAGDAVQAVEVDEGDADDSRPCRPARCRAQSRRCRRRS